MSDFQDNAPVQLKPIKACAQIIEQRNRYREALERLSKEAPIGDYVADLYSELSNTLLIEELDQRRCFAAEALKK